MHQAHRILVVGFILDVKTMMHMAEIVPRKFLLDISKVLTFPLSHMKVTMVRFRDTNICIHIQVCLEPNYGI